MSLTLRVLHRPDIGLLPQIYQTLGLDYAERVLPSIGNEILKSVVAQFDAAELITQRELVSLKIAKELEKRSSEFNIMLEDVSITHLTFGQEFTKAVEQKQIAQQDAERSKFLVEKAEQERQANIIRAEGEAEAADLISRPWKRTVMVCWPLEDWKPVRTLPRSFPAVETSPTFQTAHLVTRTVETPCYST